MHPAANIHKTTNNSTYMRSLGIGPPPPTNLSKIYIRNLISILNFFINLNLYYKT